MNKTEKIVFAGGCFWCTEAVYQNVNGVKSVVSGYTGGQIKNPAYREVCLGITGHAEGVLVTYDPLLVSLEVLLQLFFGGASSLVAITSVTAVNSRHLLYGAVFSEYLSHLRLTWKIILSYVLIDQAFAVSNFYFKKNKENEFKHYHLLGAGFTCWTIWQISTILGIVLDR